MKQDETTLRPIPNNDAPVEDVPLSRDELMKLERQLIPLLNTVQQMLGKDVKRGKRRT